MNMDGHIRMLREDEEPEEDETLINLLKATPKQKEEMQVSKFDNRSQLGQIFTGNRKERRQQEKEARRNRRKEFRDKLKS